MRWVETREVRTVRRRGRREEQEGGGVRKRRKEGREDVDERGKWSDGKEGVRRSV